MTANESLERRVADHYASEPPLRAPDRVLLAALATIDATHQRRGLFAPWRFSQMTTYAKVAAAVAVIAVIVAGYWQLAPKQGSSGGTPTAVPSLAPTAGPTAGPTKYVPPELTETFTSNIHGLALSYPAGWTARAATGPWTTGLFKFEDPAGDMIFDPALTDHLFVGAASQPLGATQFDEWSTAILAAEGCGPGVTVVVGGADGVSGTDCDMALVSVDNRGYLFWLYKGDDPALEGLDSRALFDEILATVDLHPEDAVDGAPTASP